jgi:hypothetical protein
MLGDWDDLPEKSWLLGGTIFNPVVISGIDIA